MENGLKGKYFSIVDPKGVKTVIYRIIETAKELQYKYPKYTSERLVSLEELIQNGTKRTFFIDEPDEKGEDLIMFSFTGKKIVFNRGVLKNNQVKASKTPRLIDYNIINSNKMVETKSFKYTPNLKRPLTIIDIETTLEVDPVVYYDETKDEFLGKCELKLNKPYFSFEIKG